MSLWPWRPASMFPSLSSKFTLSVKVTNTLCRLDWAWFWKSVWAWWDAALGMTCWTWNIAVWTTCWAWSDAECTLWSWLSLSWCYIGKLLSLIRCNLNIIEPRLSFSLNWCSMGNLRRILYILSFYNNICWLLYVLGHGMSHRDTVSMVQAIRWLWRNQFIA